MKQQQQQQQNEVIEKIVNLGNEIKKEIRKHESPKMYVPIRGLSNVHFDKEKNIIELGDKKSVRSFLNVAHSKKFMQSLLISAKCKELVDRKKTASIRELYYQLKHTIADTKENTFEDQSESVCPDEPLLVRINGKLRIMPGSEVVEYAEKTGKKVFEKEGKVKVEVDNLKVCAFDSEKKIGEHKAIMVMKHHSKAIKRIKTSSGRIVKVTPHHSLFTLENGEVKPIEVSKLSVGSYVALPRKIEIEINSNVINVIEELTNNAPIDVLGKIYLKGKRETISKILKRIGKDKLKIFAKGYKNVWSDVTANWKHWETVPLTLVKDSQVEINDLIDKLKITCKGSRHKYNATIKKDEFLGTVLGYLISEGAHVSVIRERDERYVVINNKSKDLLSEFINAFEKTFGDRCASKKLIKCNDGVYKLNLGYNLLSYVLEYVFDYKPIPAWEKEIPSVILDAPEECVKSFLRSFRLGDGSITTKKPRIRYHTTSLKLVNGIVFLLLRLGIFSNVYHYKRSKPRHHDMYEIRVGSREYVKLLSEITLDFKDLNLKRRSSSSGDKIPNVGKLINKLRRSCSKLKKKDYRKFNWYEIENEKKTISRVTLRKVLEVLQAYNPDPKYTSTLDELVKSDIYWDKVVGIEEADVPEYTLDLAVNPTQNFIGGNGLLILHNSDPLIVDLETMLGVLREELHLKADDKGTLIGKIIIEDSGDLIDCSKLGRSGLAIPSIVEHYKFKKVDADYVLVIETGAMFDRLVEEKYHLENNCIMVSTKGQAARGCRRLVHRLHDELKLPIIMFSVDSEENMMIEENGLLKNVKIGNYIDTLMKNNGWIGNPYQRSFLAEDNKAITISKVFDTSLSSISNVVRHKVTEPLYEIITQGGYAVKVSGSHSVMVFNDFNLVPKVVKELNHNDLLALSLKVPKRNNLKKINIAELIIDEFPEISQEIFVEENKDCKGFVKRYSENQRLWRQIKKGYCQLSEFIKAEKIPKDGKLRLRKSRIKVPIQLELTNELCRLLGYYVAEGSNHQGIEISFNSNEKKYINDVEWIVKNTFGFKVRKSNPHSTVSQLNFGGKLLGFIFEKVLGIGKYSNGKGIPWVIFNVSNEGKKEFLKGYFAGDGAVSFNASRSSLELWSKTVSRKLASDLVLLLAQIDCFSSIQHHSISKKGKQRPYLISVSDRESLKKISEIVLLLEPKAKSYLAKKIKKSPILLSLPREFIWNLRKILRKSVRKEKKNELERFLQHGIYGYKRVSYKKIKELLDMCKPDILNDKKVSVLYNMLRNRIILTPIKKIEKKKPSSEFIYDIEIPENHTFCAGLGPIALHNTDGDPWGYYIYSVMKAGSMALAHESKRLGTPGMKFVGMTMTDIEDYGLEKVTEVLKDVDKKRINELLQYPWFHKKEWKKELELMKEKGVRIEQQALASKSLEFVAEEYLPKKIKKGDLLP